jgi:hypothetical protein
MVQNLLTTEQATARGTHYFKRAGMDNERYTAAIGGVVSCEEDGLWLRAKDGQELRVAFPHASRYVRPGHDIGIAGEYASGEYIAHMLVNRSSGETWLRYAYEELSWGGAMKRVLRSHFVRVILMFIPFVNLAVGTIYGLTAIALALQVGSFFRTIGLFLIWTLVPLALIIGLTWRHDDLNEGLLIAWYLTCFPFTYVLVMASIEKAIDERNGVTRSQMQLALASLERCRDDTEP